MTSLTKEEKETIIVFNEGEEMASLETFNGKLIRSCQQYGLEPISVDEYGAYRFKLPKSFIKIRAPRQLTEEQRVAAGERLKKYRETPLTVEE